MGAWHGKSASPASGETLKTFGRKVDAQRWLADRQAAALRGDLISPEMQIMTVAELAAEWRATWPGRLQPSSQRRSDELLALYVLPSLGAERAATLSYSAVQRFLAALPAALSPSTVRKVHATLSALFTEGIRAGHVRVNPCRHQRLPRIVKAERIIITVEQAEALAVEAGRIASRTKGDAPSGPQAALAVRLSAYTGLRAGEQWALRRRDIDLPHGRVHVSRALKLIGGRLEFGPTKTHQERRVSVPKFVLAGIEALLEDREAHPDTLLFQGRIWRADPPQPVRATHLQACPPVGVPPHGAALARPAAFARLAPAWARGADPRGQAAARAREHPDDRRCLRPPHAGRR